MTNQYLASSVIENVRQRGTIPSSSNGWTDARLYTLMDAECRTYIWPLLREIDEEFFVRRYAFSSASGTESYRLPSRCLGEAFKALLKSTDGGTSWFPVPRLEPQNASRLVAGFHIEDDLLVLSPTPTATESYRLLYYLRPNRPVAATDVAEILTITRGASTTTLTLTSGADFTIATGTYDVVDNAPGVRILEFDLTCSSTSPITISSVMATSIAVGDYLCPVGTSPIPNIPVECFPLLEQRMVCVSLKGKPGYEVELQELRDMDARVRSLLRPKSGAHPQTIQNFNAPGLGRMRSKWRGFF